MTKQFDPVTQQRSLLFQVSGCEQGCRVGQGPALSLGAALFGIMAIANSGMGGGCHVGGAAWSRPLVPFLPPYPSTPLPLHPFTSLPISSLLAPLGPCADPAPTSVPPACITSLTLTHSHPRSLSFTLTHAQVEYPEIEEGVKPRYRIMSAFEQRVEATDKNWK